jgi:hypothetical protein
VIGELVALIAIGVGAAAVGAWLGIVVLAPRLGRRLDAQAREEERAGEPADQRRESDDRTG